MRSLFCPLLVLGLLSINNLFAQTVPAAIWKTDAYSIFSDRVEQGKDFVAKAISANEIVSNYKSPANLFQSTKLSFKFSINGKDNEMAPGVDHHFNVTNTVKETPLIQFGEQLKDNSGETNTYLQPDTRLTIRVDMKKVLDAFKSQGYFTSFKGDKIYKEDFKGLFVAGNTLPMTWDFDNLHTKEGLELKDENGDGIYETTLTLNAQKDEKQTDAHWSLTKDISAFPQYRSEHALLNALYNMSTEEMIKAVEPDSTFRTGKEWAGVWTRDISYSIILSMAYLQPEVAKKSLMRKVNKNKKIIQDTGTGGAYPCSTDRMIWATAAWEIYKATGDKDWLEEAYIIIKNSIEDDMNNAYDGTTGLVKGESSFLDWREQTYPKWMQPADIYESENLGTNAVHYNANAVMAEWGTILEKKIDVIQFRNNASKIKSGVNRYLWMKDKGYYAQYMYGRDFKMVSPRSEALGEALCVLFGISDSAKNLSIIEKTPVTDYGISCIYPQIPNIPPYHNNAVWPFVQSYWALASAKAGNETSVMESLSAIWRAAALFLTNKENFVADNGDFAGTVINSSNMLWSLSGNLAMIHKLIFGIEFQTDKLIFHPFVPQALGGKHQLSNFRYQRAILDISLEGSGNSIRSFIVDSMQTPVFEFPSRLAGKHTIRIILGNDNTTAGKINKVGNYTTLATPITTNNGKTISWQKDPGAKKYKVMKNASLAAISGSTSYTVIDTLSSSWQVIAVDEKEVESFASEPLVIDGKKKPAIYEVEKFAPQSGLSYKGASGGFTEISKSLNTMINIPVMIDEAGLYSISFRYANGNGPVNTENKCAIRTLDIDRRKSGTVIFPQRGNGEWSNWGFSNAVHAQLQKGAHTVTLSFGKSNENMNEEINQAMLDYLQVVRIK